jgi:hypothetical protein
VDKTPLRAMAAAHARACRLWGRDDPRAVGVRRELDAAMLAKCVDRYGRGLAPDQVDALVRRLREAAATPWPAGAPHGRFDPFPRPRQGRPHAQQTGAPDGHGHDLAIVAAVDGHASISDGAA